LFSVTNVGLLRIISFMVIPFFWSAHAPPFDWN
jgi:hypothetical protein